MGDKLNNCDFIIFALDHYNPLGVARSLGEQGYNSIFIAEKSRMDISSCTKYAKEYIRVDNVEEGYDILMNDISNRVADTAFLYTCDDYTMGYLDDRYDEWKDRFIGFNAGENTRIKKYMNKYEILKIAERHGLKCLKTRVLEKGETPEDIEYPIITKSISPIVGGWKSDVFICHNKEDLSNAYEKIKAPKIIAQSFLDKKNECCIDGFCIDKGRVMLNTIESRYNYIIQGYYSPYMTVNKFMMDDIGACLKEVMSEIGYEGIFSIEFLIDKDDNYYFSEINFRNSGWSYASTVAGINLPVLWAECMLDNKLPDDIAFKDEGPFMAMVEPIDYNKRVNEGRAEFGEWLRDFKQAKCLYYYNEDDIGPFMYMCKNWDKLG